VDGEKKAIHRVESLRIACALRPRLHVAGTQELDLIKAGNRTAAAPKVYQRVAKNVAKDPTSGQKRLENPSDTASSLLPGRRIPTQPPTRCTTSRSASVSCGSARVVNAVTEAPGDFDVGLEG
jgi:hypothetical protein